MGQEVNKGDLKKTDMGHVNVFRRGNLWGAICIFAACAVLYFADILLSDSAVWATVWQEYFINRSLYLILFSVPLLYCAYIYRIRGVFVSVIILIALYSLRVIYYPDMLPFYKSIVFTAFLMVLGLLIAHYQNIRDMEKRATELIKASERRYRALTENLADVIWAMDMNLCYTYVNPAVTRLRGYTAEEAIKQTIEELLTPESVEIARKVLAEERTADNSGSKELYRTRLLNLVEKRKDGTTVPVEVKVIFLRDSSGNATEILGVTREITK